MMLGEAHRPHPTVHIPPWPVVEDPTAPETYSPMEAFTALQHYLPSNVSDPDSDPEFSGPDSPVDAYSCDHFRMYEFKVRRCARGRSHDWTECPYAHPGEKARRRDPRKYHYSGTACPDFRKGGCKRGDSCEFAHGVFECWLHPARYRTQPCKDGANCRRRVCFFAHTPDQLRVLPQDTVDYSLDGSPPLRHYKLLPFSLSPASISPPVSPRSDSVSSPPMTQSLSRPLGAGSINDMVRSLQLNKVKSMPSSWSSQLRYSSGFGSSPRGSSVLGPGFRSLPTTPTGPRIEYLDVWDEVVEEEPVMERVESGRELRVKMFEKLSKENCMERVGPDVDAGRDSGEGPDVGWISEMVK